MEAMRAERRQQREAPPDVVARHAAELADAEERLAAVCKEYEAFKETSEQVAEARDAELSRVLASGAALREELSVLQARQQQEQQQVCIVCWCPNARLVEPTLNGERNQEAAPSEGEAGSTADDAKPTKSNSIPMYSSGSFANHVGLLSRRPPLEHGVDFPEMPGEF